MYSKFATHRLFPTVTDYDHFLKVIKDRTKLTFCHDANLMVHFKDDNISEADQIKLLETIPTNGFHLWVDDIYAPWSSDKSDQYLSEDTEFIIVAGGYHSFCRVLDTLGVPKKLYMDHNLDHWPPASTGTELIFMLHHEMADEQLKNPPDFVAISNEYNDKLNEAWKKYILNDSGK